MILDHVAVLTTDIEQFKVANRLSSDEPVEAFTDTGSREQYIDGDHLGGRLLLMQPHGEGPYLRALTKRGPGLHHLAVAAADLAAALAQWRACGWQVHPASAAAIPPDSGAFLFQRGVPTLVELFVGRTDLGAPQVEVTLPVPREALPEIAGVRIGQSAVKVVYQGRDLQLNQL
jgi:methylmalonyl-CoA/ethylmalonyl-CoA epimerase